MSGRKKNDLDWEALRGLRAGTCVAVRHTDNRPPTVGRLMRQGPEMVVLQVRRPSRYRQRYAESPYDRVVKRTTFRGARVVEGLWSHHLDADSGLARGGEPVEVLRRGVAESRWRGVAVRQEGTRVLVEVGENRALEWVHEMELETPAERDQPPPSKPGRRHSDPIVDALNEDSYRRRVEEQTS